MTCTRESHAALKLDAAKWATFKLVGFMDDGEGGTLELRNCSAPCCASTLAKAVTK